MTKDYIAPMKSLLIVIPLAKQEYTDLVVMADLGARFNRHYNFAFLGKTL